MAQNTCFRSRKVLLGVRRMGDVIRGKYAQITHHKGAWIGSFKPKRQNLSIAISPELLIRLNKQFDDRVQTVRGTSWVVRHSFKANTTWLAADMWRNGYDVIFPQWVLRFRQNSVAWCRIMCRFLANGRNRNRKALFVTKPLHYAQFYGFEEQNSCLKFYIFYRPYMTLQWKPKSCHMTTLQLKTYLLLQSFRAKATIKTH